MNDLENITEMIDTGLRNNSRKRKIIPESDNAQFDKESVTTKESAKKNSQSQSTLKTLTIEQKKIVLDRIQENIGRTTNKVQSNSKTMDLEK